MMFKSSRERDLPSGDSGERVTSVLGEGIAWQGSMSGSGGVRIEGAFDGEISVRGLVVIGSMGRVTCDHLRAETVLIAGSLKGNISANKVDIASTGRVWGNVTAQTFSTQEGAFLRGQITMEEKLDMDWGAAPGEADEPAPEENLAQAPDSEE